MQINDTTNLTGIIQDQERMTGLGVGNISGNATKLKEFIARTNNWYDREVAIIIKADNRWTWDDSNQTDLPIATANIVSGQATYQFDPTWLRINRVQMANATTGVFSDLISDDLTDENGISRYNAYSPLPYSYGNFQVQGGTITLDTVPTVNITGGLKVFFQRTVVHFQTSDTTLQPGFPAPFHRLLSYGPAYDYCLEYSKPQAVAYRQEISNLEDELETFIAERSGYEKPHLSTRRQTYR